MADLTLWDPFRRMMTLRNAFDRLLVESFWHSFNGWLLLPSKAHTVAIDLAETEDDLLLEASLPGFEPDEVKISVIGNRLVLKGEKKEEEEKEEKEEQGRYYFHERRVRRVMRAIRLPTEVNADAAEAVFDQGVLKLTLPKVEAVKPKHIEIKVS